MSLDKAKAYAFLLLKYRPRSEQEIRQRMARKKFAPALISSTIEFLKSKKFVDDQAFSDAWVRSKLEQSVGARRIKQQLKLKGVSASLIEGSLQKFKASDSEEDTIRQIIDKKLQRANKDAPEIFKRRIYAYLMRRGFSPENIIEVISQYRLE